MTSYQDACQEIEARVDGLLSYALALETRTKLTDIERTRFDLALAHRSAETVELLDCAREVILEALADAIIGTMNGIALGPESPETNTEAG